MLTLALALQGFLLSEANAQTFDAQGPALPPDGADVRDPALGLGGGHLGAPVFTITGHTSTAVLIERLAQGPTVDDDRLVASLIGSNVSAQTGIYGPVGIGFSLPVWFLTGGVTGAGPAVGDATIWLPVSLVSLESGFKLGVSPILSLPTGADARYLGDNGLGVGGVLTTGFRVGAFFANADVGGDLAPQTGVQEWPGGPHFRTAVDAGIAPTDVWAVHAEYRSRVPFVSAAPSLPSEIMGTFKVRPQERYWLNASVGTALTRGPGASAVRVLLGVTLAPGTAPVEEAIVAAPPPKELHIVDNKGFPVSGAIVVAGNIEALSDIEGYADLPPRAVRSGVISVEHPHYEAAQITVNPDDPFWTAELLRKPVPVAISVVGPKGSLMAVEVEMDGPYDPGPPRIDEAGVHHWDLREGAWFVRMASSGLGTQERTIVIEESRVDPIRVDAVLASSIASSNKVRVEVVDRLGRPVEDAVVALENRDLGTTGTGGDLTVEGLKAGMAELTIRSDKFGENAKLELVIDESGEQTVQAVVDWRPGSVQVSAVDPSGRPMDATVNFIGPANLPPRDTGTDGEEIFVMRPGRWNVEISAPGFGTQMRTIEVTDVAGELVSVDVGMIGDEGGPAEVRLRVRDVEGKPVSGAEVKLDGKSLGTTGPEGDLALKGLNSGKRTFTISSPLIAGQEKVVELVDGRQVTDATVYWVDGVVDVSATTVDGTPVDAKIIVEGPQTVAPTQLGRDGADRFLLGPGTWNVQASVPGYAPQNRKVVVAEGEGRRQEIRFKLAPEGEVGTVAVKVVGPDGKPVESAVVKFDGDAIGEADKGRLVADSVALGPLLVGAEAEGMRAKDVGTAVMQTGNNEVVVPLEWAPGAMEVQVQGPDGKPVDARITIRAPDGSMPIDPRVAVGGETVIGATPGTWQMVVEADGLRTEVVDLVLPDESMLTKVPVQLKEIGAEEPPTVMIKAENDRGAAIANAEVVVEGKVVGRTTSAGTFELTELPSDNFVVTVRPPDGSVYDEVKIPVNVNREQLAASGGEFQAAVVLPDAAQQVRVVVQDPSGNLVEAEVVAIKGANQADVVNVQGGEKGVLSLKPGAYTITAKTEDGSLATTDIVVPDRDPTSGAGQTTYIPGADQSGLSQDGLSIVELEGGMPILSLRVEQVSAAMSDGMIVPVNPILFDTGQYLLREDAAPLVRDLARWLTAHREAALIEVGGHTDDIGGVVYNQQLSERRARTVMDALIDNGVAPERLRSRGYGLSRPVTMNVDDATRQMNRRVALVVLEWNE